MDYAVARRKMVENQIRPNRVTDPLVLAAMAELPREAFLPPHLRGVAYVDEDIPLGAGRYLMEPLVTAQLLQAAEIDGDDVVLEIGCGTGYTTAIVARMASTVVAVESDPALLRHARDALAGLGVDTVTLVEGPLDRGFPEQAPYDVILFGGAVSRIPEAISAQLTDGGRMLAVLAGADGPGEGTIFMRAGGSLSRRGFCEAATPFLIGFAPQPTFQF
jgi:protein-L-isoaspartate(D-aspartate) O-methyltransferase